MLVIDFIFQDWVILAVVGILVGIGIGVLAMNDFKIAKTSFLSASVLAAGGIMMWGIKTPQNIGIRVIVVGIFFAIIGILAVESWRYVDKKQNRATESSPHTSDKSTLSSPHIATPSLLFVFGAPLGDNDSATWIMLLKHYGPEVAYNCDIGFYDNDRKNIDHEWRARNPASLYPPPSIAGESQKRIYVAEASPEGSGGHFMWNPVDPNSQHYTISISCRDGVFEEKWEVTRVDGILRSRIKIEHGSQWIKNHPNLDPVVFRYEDPEFVKTALATEMPKVSKGKIVHPGWKPNYTFNVPAAIIDSNGNVQVVSGVKSPSGSTLTDFGSWNILTKHFGDNQLSSK